MQNLQYWPSNMYPCKILDHVKKVLSTYMNHFIIIHLHMIQIEFHLCDFFSFVNFFCTSTKNPSSQCHFKVWQVNKRTSINEHLHLSAYYLEWFYIFFLRLLSKSIINANRERVRVDRPSSSSRSRSWQRKPYKAAPIVRRC